MKERPILFSAPMVRAILAGRKTQTRRIIKPQPVRSLPHTKSEGNLDIHRPMGWRWQDRFAGRQRSLFAADEAGGVHEVTRDGCPFGQPGDRLWVRETWCDADCFYQSHENDVPSVIGYAADLSAIQFNGTKPRKIPKYDIDQWNWDSVKWRPSIFLRRWASRITLGVTDVYVERLGDLTGENARAERINLPRCSCEVCSRSVMMCPADAGSHVEEFSHLWDKINGERAPWSASPWVWVVEFRRVEQAAKEST